MYNVFKNSLYKTKMWFKLIYEKKLENYNLIKKYIYIKIRLKYIDLKIHNLTKIKHWLQ